MGSGGATVACDAPTKVFKATCGGSGCHEANQTAPDLFTPPVQDALLGKKPTYACTSMNYLDSTGPVTNGVLMKRITGSTCLDQMPMGKPALSSDDIKCVSDWLTSVQK